MAIVTTDNKYYAEIAATIREKLGATDKYTPAQMAAAILSISGGGSGGLPSGYTQLLYIESLGTQYINTDFKPSQNTDIEIVISDWLNTETSTAVFGSQGTGDRYEVFISSGGDYRSYYAGAYKNFSGVSAENKTTIHRTSNVTTFNGTAVTNNAATFTCGNSLYLFACNVNGAATRPASLKVYSCKIYDNDTLVRDYIPCKHPSGEVGLYDVVNGAFHGNSGTGEFTGAAVRELPEGYTQADYIQSSGSQYIDTGVIGKSGIKAIGKFRPLSLESSIVLGCYNPQRCYMISFNGSNIRYGYADWYTATSAVSANTDYEFEVDFSAGHQHLKLNGTTYISSSNTTKFTNNYTMYAFAYQDGAAGAGDYAKCRVYSLQLYDNGTLVRDYVPCANTSGEYGLFDLASNQFYGSAGSGAFTGG